MEKSTSPLQSANIKELTSSMSSGSIPSKVDIAVARGDGIGPEIMDATLRILQESGAQLNFHDIEVGEKVYLKGFPAGIEPKAWDIIRHTKAFLKAPIATPQGGGFKSLNVTIRTTLGLYANVRPCVAYHPFVATKHPGMDVVIIRENEEDLYTGIEYQHSAHTVHALKVVSREGCERIIRYAFEYARSNGRKKVTCFTKDNILKLSDGLFHKVFDEIAPEYPDITPEHWIIDIGSAKLADTPTAFDVIVTLNLYGDILSDVAAQIAGSVGLAGSANIGERGAMFEAIHGSAPRRANQNLANPSGLILAAVQMLVHINQFEAAERMHNAWLKTIEEGIHTYDIFKESSKEKVGTKEFADAIIQRLGKTPEFLKPMRYVIHYASESKTTQRPIHQKSAAQKTLVGCDIFIDSTQSVEQLAELMQNTLKQTPGLQMTTISNRGVKVWPEGFLETAHSDLWRCRIMSANKGEPVAPYQLIDLLKHLLDARLDAANVVNLYRFGDRAGYTLSSEEQ